MPDSPVSPRSSVSAVIFDWAGTVLDFGSIAPVEAFGQAFAANGLEVNKAELRAPMGAAKREHVALVLANPVVQLRWQARTGRASDAADIDRIYADFLVADTESCARYSTLIPGTLETVTALRERGIAIGSTTGYPRPIIDILIPLAAAQGYAPDACVTVDEQRGRPFPDMLLATALQLAVPSVWSCVAVDDSPSGLVAARAAGMWAVGVTASGNEVGLSRADWEDLDKVARSRLRQVAAERLEEAGAHFVIDTVADLLPVIDAIEMQLSAGERP